VHCIAILSLISPCISPWRVQERIWRHFSDLRLLHLLEDKLLIHSVIGLLDASEAVYGNRHLNTDIKSTKVSAVEDKGGISKSALLVSKAIVITLSNLRQESDNNFYICTVGIVHIAASIFCYSRFENNIYVFEVKGPRTRFFKDILCDGNVPNWIIMDIILSVEKYFISRLRDGSHRDGLFSKENKIKILDEFHGSRIMVNKCNQYIDITKNSRNFTIEVYESDEKMFNIFDFINTFRSQFFD
jgi:hypothetical protein